MRYNLGLMDQYPIEAAGSTIENNPMYRVIFKHAIDPIKLEDAFKKAIVYYPLFGTEVAFDSKYYLRTNERPLKIIEAKEEDRPKNFGKNTNGYPWQCCIDGRNMTFEWLHGVSDGVGALHFLKQVLLIYFGYPAKEANAKFLVAPGLEPFFDQKEKGIDFSEDPEGFSFKEFPAHKNRGYRTDSYSLRADTSEILKLAKTTQSSVAPIITVLFSMAIRKHLPLKMKNRNVACNVVLDLRRPLNYETMHNCVEYKRITYTDLHESMSFTSVVQEYKEVLDKARIVQNVVRIITDRVKLFLMYHIFPSKKWVKFCVKMVGKILKDIDCNFVMTYPGKIDLPDEVMEKIENIDFKVWHDFGECIIAAVDFNGMFNLNISENFVEKGIVEDFIEISRSYGIHWEMIAKGEFEQAHFEEE